MSLGAHGRLRNKRPAFAGMVTLVLATLFPLACIASPPLTLTYDLYSAGIPVLSLEFAVNESDNSYHVVGVIRSTGIADVFSRYVLRTESNGTVTSERVEPRTYLSDSNSRLRQRSAGLEYGADGSIMTSLVPPAETSDPAATIRQVRASIDPLAGLLQESHIVARSGRCSGRIPIFDGRRRYDLVYADEGMDHIPASDHYAYAGDARRCKIDIVKIAGFTESNSYSDKVDSAVVWLATLRPNVSPLPVRLEFGGALGPTKVSLVSIRDVQ